MMFKIKRQPTRLALFLRWARFFFLVVGVLALSYCAIVLLDRWVFQAYQTWRFERALKDAQTSARTINQTASSPLSAKVEADRARAESFGIDGLAGSPLGRIEISSIGVMAMIMEGVDGRTLRHTVGHIPGTPLPGQQGNVALAGHRDTFFRGLRNIHKDDEITLTTLHGSYRYSVDSTQVVEPEDIKVLGASVDDFLTLVTCYPFYFVGPAPKRFIVRAHKISE
ncbi:MAG TPA: class D sortase [Terriglobia bacterium]|nr:class D sortase [Terriglobia bacterium]